MEAWQHVKLTGTNRSIGLIPPARQALDPSGSGGPVRLCAFTRRGKRQAATLRWPETEERTRPCNTRPTHASFPMERRRGGGRRVARFLHRVWTTWWLWRGGHTRSHPELGREDPQRRWYCTLRCGRVGRCQVFQARCRHMQACSGDLYRTVSTARRGQGPDPAPRPELCFASGDAGWSSPVARQAHNLKVVGSNPTPATILSRYLAEALLPGFGRSGQLGNGWVTNQPGSHRTKADGYGPG